MRICGTTPSFEKCCSPLPRLFPGFVPELCFHRAQVANNVLNPSQSGRHLFAPASGRRKIHYETIREWQTRILEIHPGGFGSPITATLHVIDLIAADGAVLHVEQKHIVYKALSYCWGTEASSHTLDYNGHQFRVNGNLHSALKRLRDPNIIVYLWVDAICINQHDTTERSIQVSNMIDIYSKAEEVIVWLGEDANKDGLLLGIAASRIPQTRSSRSHVIWALELQKNQSYVLYRQHADLLREKASVNLDTCLGNWNGDFGRGGSSVTKSEKNLRIIGTALSAELCAASGTWIRRELDLRAFWELPSTQRHVSPSTGDNVPLTVVQNQLSESQASSKQFSNFADAVMSKLTLDGYPHATRRETVRGFFCNLVTNPWFTRIWVKQEVWASRSLRVQYGASSIPWSDLEICLRWSRCSEKAFTGFICPSFTTYTDCSAGVQIHNAITLDNLSRSG